MEIISVFDMLKVGIGPSSSHTLGPWKAANRFLKNLRIPLKSIESIKVELFGSLSLTGKGHATDIAVVMGLTGEIPEEIEPQKIPLVVSEVKTTGKLKLNFEKEIPFSFEENIVFHKHFLPFHPNGIRFTASTSSAKITETYYSTGGGFICTENENSDEIPAKTIPYPVQNGLELLSYCKLKKISDVVYENELALNNAEYVDSQLEKIWKTMLECMYLGCTTKGTLPGGLNVKRRANEFYTDLNGPENVLSLDDWLHKLRNTEVKFRQILKWVSCFALSVNEVNASLGKVVTAPTNGSSGVIPAVLMYYLMIENHQAGFEDIKRFLFVAGEIGSIFKKGATISAAMGGCQAEIGVSSAMAAGALCELQGGTPEQVLVAAEIAMEHHLGLTCDPIGGLVQIPCIERNSMGALKAITAAELALGTNPKETKVPLDKVIATMWETAKDMNHKYKETSQGGLAVAVNSVDC
ncbi:L-serine ammonia-lyase [Lacihabitans soyangensis]|uniref:L-serine dehydratase n=1 Tax=Lacihabitans soyangensis TaxID=869394 RepID=A0AAE3KVS1_9BACT|nr:L-serine ammonia-lyase [Lacihabitans soyangensis]MCP9761635.1 L-serine ammonia-lyase [Lacihabitans soyangensis]